MAEIYIKNDQDTEFMVLPSPMRFFKDSEKKLFKNLVRSTLMIEKK